MNRFKNKKKGAKDLDSADPRPSLESESSFSLFRRGKKNLEQEAKQEIDLSLALPSNDDFRTSLLMNGLSARFSMLREQDDPNSKIGKASDDSVLFPKRQSRLADFGFSGGNALGDIAEVESIRAPPFMRTDSIASNESGGVMTRSRPLESNVLFGGRQKIYKIAAGTASTKNVADGMSGRALYDDDVSLSAFQKWRQAEKDKEAGMMMCGDDEEDGEKTISNEARGTEDASFITRSESPLPPGYNKKRETSSTTSSTPSGGRNSTAATSIVSQSNTASKDIHSQQTATSSAASTPSLDRHVTRTRRLYEQGLTQDLQEQQHSVLSRVDTLARRPGGARTPELGPNSPSPTMQTFTDRWAAYGGERRTVVTKGSAPNLRSISPPATGPLNGSMTLNTRVSNVTDGKPGVFTPPPLSPPISDAGTGEQVPLNIQPQDLGKATAMNMFQKPNATYDDSKYAERQRQLQIGRETPTRRFHDDPDLSFSESRSQSDASNRRQEVDTRPAIVSVPSDQDKAASAQQDAEVPSSGETIESPILNEHVFSNQTSPEVRLERPSDQDHPAFRNPAPASTPMFPSKAKEQQWPAKAGLLSVGLQAPTLADSPTLGPNVGLSGMVRQHLRSESDVSSIYAPHNDAQSPPSRRDDPLKPKKPWEESAWTASPEAAVEQSPPDARKPALSKREESTMAQPEPRTFLDSPRSPDEEDEFASQLANARRRVREKLTSFVETDAQSFSPPTVAAPTSDLPTPPPRSNPLGILKVKSSRGSLIDRGREAVPHSIKEHDETNDTEARLNEEEDAHPSLRAFRQARREVQRRKDLEAGARSLPQMGQPMMPAPLEQMSGAPGPRRGTSRTPSSERQTVNPRQYRQMRENSPQDAPLPPRSRSKVARDRSESENSEGSGRSRSGPPPPRSRDRPEYRDGQPMPAEMLSAPGQHSPMIRSPGLPGTDIRRSPHMPPVAAFPNGPRGNTPAAYHDSNGPSPTMRSHPGRSMTGPMPSGQFPLSPQGGKFDQPRGPYQPNHASGSAPATPTGPLPRRPSVATNSHATATGSTLTDSMKRVVNKKDISEPTFVMSTSRVPTTNLPSSAAGGNRSRSGSVADPGSPPPLPPVNPRRRHNAAFSASSPQLPLVPPPAAPFAQTAEGDWNSAFSANDESRRRLRKASSEMKMDARATIGPGKRISPPQVAVGPPAGRA
ncbi:hypothetical protein M406DRAFT_225918, partial [Cryphonectria parasitica EP155]